MEEKERAPLPGLVDLLLDAVFLVDVDGHIVYVNAACERIFGYAPEELIGKSLLDYVVPEDRERTLEEAARVMTGQPRIGFENRYRHKAGHAVHIMWSARWLAAERMRIGVARDVSAQKHAEEVQRATYAVSEAAHSANDLDSLFHEIHRIVEKLVPLAGLAVAMRDRSSARLGFAYQLDHRGHPLFLQEAVARSYCEDVIRSGRPILLHGDAPSGPGEDPASGAWLVMPLVAQTEAIGAMVLKCFPETTCSDKDKALLHFVSAQIATAIERAQFKNEMLRAAHYDELTGLPNRRLLYERMDSALARCRRHGHGIALLYLDIDDFKQVNDSLGHTVGDMLLKTVASRLERCVRGVDTVARLGGDEFVVLLETVGAPGDARTVAEKIRSAVSEPILLNELTLTARASIGIAFCPEHGVEAAQLLIHADAAMYLDKKRTPRD